MDSPFSQRHLGDPQERLLRGIPAFARLPPKARHDLASHLAEQRYPMHGRVLDEGEPADRLFLIEEGDIVGEAALLTGTPRDASLVVIENAQLLALLRADLIETLDRDLPAVKATNGTRVRPWAPLHLDTSRGSSE